MAVEGSTYTDTSTNTDYSSSSDGADGSGGEDGYGDALENAQDETKQNVEGSDTEVDPTVADADEPDQPAEGSDVDDYKYDYDTGLDDTTFKMDDDGDASYQEALGTAKDTTKPQVDADTQSLLDTLTTLKPDQTPEQALIETVTIIEDTGILDEAEQKDPAAEQQQQQTQKQKKQYTQQEQLQILNASKTRLSRVRAQVNQSNLSQKAKDGQLKKIELLYSQLQQKQMKLLRAKMAKTGAEFTKYQQGNDSMRNTLAALSKALNGGQKASEYSRQVNSGNLNGAEQKPLTKEEQLAQMVDAAEDGYVDPSLSRKDQATATQKLKDLAALAADTKTTGKPTESDQDAKKAADVQDANDGTTLEEPGADHLTTVWTALHEQGKITKETLEQKLQELADKAAGVMQQGAEFAAGIKDRMSFNDVRSQNSADSVDSKDGIKERLQGFRDDTTDLMNGLYNGAVTYAEERVSERRAHKLTTNEADVSTTGGIPERSKEELDEEYIRVTGRQPIPMDSDADNPDHRASVNPGFWERTGPTAKLLRSIISNTGEAIVDGVTTVPAKAVQSLRERRM
jgi:hypothetical protein